MGDNKIHQACKGLMPAILVAVRLSKINGIKTDMHMFQNICFFMDANGIETNLKFVKAKAGPKALNLNEEIDKLKSKGIIEVENNVVIPSSAADESDVSFPVYNIISKTYFLFSSLAGRKEYQDILIETVWSYCIKGLSIDETFDYVKRWERAKGNSNAEKLIEEAVSDISKLRMSRF